MSMDSFLKKAYAETKNMVAEQPTLHEALGRIEVLETKIDRMNEKLNRIEQSLRPSELMFLFSEILHDVPPMLEPLEERIKRIELKIENDWLSDENFANYLKTLKKPDVV